MVPCGGCYHAGTHEQSLTLSRSRSRMPPARRIHQRHPAPRALYRDGRAIPRTCGSRRVGSDKAAAMTGLPHAPSLRRKRQTQANDACRAWQNHYNRLQLPGGINAMSIAWTAVWTCDRLPLSVLRPPVAKSFTIGTDLTPAALAVGVNCIGRGPTTGRPRRRSPRNHAPDRPITSKIRDLSRPQYS